MKTKSNTMVKIMITAIVIAFIIMVGAIIYRAEGAEKTGYLIGISSAGKTSIHKVTDPAVADSIVARHFGHVFTGFNTAEVLKYTPYYEFRTLNKHLYCEKKNIVRCKNGRLKYVKLKRNKR